MPFDMYEKGEVLDLDIVGLGSGSEGIAHSEDKLVFVPKTLPGDRVKARLLKKQKARYQSELVEILEESPQRREPRCSHYQDCGGCNLQHVPYEQQLQWKLDTTRHWINRSPLASFVENTQFDSIASPQEYGYRHRVKVRVKNDQIGFLKAGSNQFLPIRECPVMKEGLFEKIQQEAKKLKSGQTSLQFDLEMPNNIFSQANKAVNELMKARILSEVNEMSPTARAVDFYCGAGNFSFLLDQVFDEVIGAEENPRALEVARTKESSIRWIEGRCENIIDLLMQEQLHADCVLLDPARPGSFSMMPKLNEWRPTKIIYISCKLDSLIRDLTQLVKKGPYKISRWTCADLLPQTKHIESIVSLDIDPNAA